MAVVNKSFYSPYVWFTDTSTEANAFGTSVDTINGIFDYIQVVSDDSTDDVEMQVTPVGSGTHSTVKISSGDSLHGPFSKVTMVNNNATCDVFIYERHKTITN